ncbi:MAG: universal stress protein [Verrucomicrobia subdivision 3 bacterium]|nr:universal stress protein [Limisphaerales bacterium]
MGKAKPAERAEAKEVKRNLDIRKVLAPVDFSTNAEAAVVAAGELAEKFGAELYVMYVVEPAPFISDLRNVVYTLSDKQLALKAETELEALAVRFVPPSVPVKRLVKIGKAHHEITRAAKKLGVDLIVVSTHGYTGIKHTLMGSTAERVVRHADCPVFVVRAEK